MDKSIVEGKAKGGYARADALTKKERSNISKRAAEVRWAKGMPKATHDGELEIGEIVIPCAVLEDGTRVLTQSGLLRAIGRSVSPRGGAYEDDSGLDRTPVFMRSKSIKPFVSSELLASTESVAFLLKRGGKAIGYRAEALPLICDAFLSARASDALSPNQMATAMRCEILVRSLAKVGIIALVDEATGYQEIRDRKALQAILDQYLQKELAAWAKRFPDEFYQEIFRLRGWEWRGMKVNRPQVVAKYTTDIVYERIAPGILQELEIRNPKDLSGSRRAKHHQWLSVDVGHPALAQHLHAVIGFMRASDSWDGFKRILDRAFPKRGDTLFLPMKTG